MNGNGQHELDSSLLIAHEHETSSERISIAQLQHLVRLLDSTEVSELEVKRTASGTRLLLRKAHSSESLPLLPVTLAETRVEAPPLVETKHTVVAPLVGIFHTWAKPKGKSLVSVGDRIKVGQLVGTILSLNVINEVESVLAGRVSELLVQDGQPVEYGQPLLVLDTIEENGSHG
jgi:acetyl-CoA carboxylase biotin carboxyl carrier protein